MKNFRIIFLSLCITFCFCSIFSFAGVVYKDISSISIKLNFKDDYESYAEDGLPEFTYGEEADCNVYTMNTKYGIESADWYDSNTERDYVIGGTPKIVIYLYTKDYPYQDYSNEKDYYYRFVSGYSQSTCYVSGGEFVSATRINQSTLKVVVKIKPIKGVYGEPTDVHWVDDYGHLAWDEPENRTSSGYYDIALYRNDKKVTDVNAYHGHSYNFRSFMTKEGSYEARVRTVPGTDTQKAYGKKSEYVSSGSIDISEDRVYKGGNTNNSNNSNNNSISNNTNGNAGWVQLKGIWYYKNAKGDILRNQWLQDNKKWYWLTGTGAMQTGWMTNAYDHTFYFQDSGEMATGWMMNGDNYHYFIESGVNEGVMCKNRWLLYDNRWYYFDNNGNMVTGWQSILNKYGVYKQYYFYPKNATTGLYGYLATNTVIDGYYTVNGDGEWVH